MYDHKTFNELKADPQKWFIEVCIICGCQLGPGIGSRTPSGRCTEESHRQHGGSIMLVDALPASQQIDTHSAKIAEKRNA